MENIKQFFEKVQADAGLQEKLKALQEKTQEEAVDAVIALAGENGFEATREGLMEYIKAAGKAVNENAELDDAELDAVAGGASDGWIIGSAFTLGFACLVSLVGREFRRCSLDPTPGSPGDGD